MADYDLSLVPRLTEPTTAYDLLTIHLPKVMREEPARVRMAIYGCAGPGAERYCGSDGEVSPPSCGTIGCIAGWTCILAGAPGDFKGISVGDDAARLFGFKGDEETADLADLFYGIRTRDTDQGSPAHAERVIESMAKFAANNEIRLRAAIITPGQLAAPAE